jgi:hypothetical protein
MPPEPVHFPMSHPAIFAGTETKLPGGPAPVFACRRITCVFPLNLKASNPRAAGWFLGTRVAKQVLP